MFKKSKFPAILATLLSLVFLTVGCGSKDDDESAEHDNRRHDRRDRRHHEHKPVRYEYRKTSDSVTIRKKEVQLADGSKQCVWKIRHLESTSDEVFKQKYLNLKKTECEKNRNSEFQGQVTFADSLEGPCKRIATIAYTCTFESKTI